MQQNGLFPKFRRCYILLLRLYQQERYSWYPLSNMYFKSNIFVALTHCYVIRSFNLVSILYLILSKIWNRFQTSIIIERRFLSCSLTSYLSYSPFVWLLAIKCEYMMSFPYQICYNICKTLKQKTNTPSYYRHLFSPSIQMF